MAASVFEREFTYYIKRRNSHEASCSYTLKDVSFNAAPSKVEPKLMLLGPALKSLKSKQDNLGSKSSL